MTKLFALGAAILMLGTAACATTPKTPTEREDLMKDAQRTLKRMESRDPTLSGVLARSAGYVVFPSIGKGGILVGGAFGRGIAYEGGVAIGYVSLNQASIGAQLGGQTFSELVVFKTQSSLEQLKAGKFTFGAEATAVALKAGAAASTQFNRQGVAVFTHAKGGLMVGLSVTGQKLGYQPLK